jgi:hypothetical protein
MIFDSRVDETGEQGMTNKWLRGEFRMKLAADKPRMIAQLDHFHQFVINGKSRNNQSRIL